MFEVIFLAGHIVGYAPSVTAMAASISIQVAAGTVIGVQRLHRCIPPSCPSHISEDKV